MTAEDERCPRCDRPVNLTGAYDDESECGAIDGMTCRLVARCLAAEAALSAPAREPSGDLRGMVEALADAGHDDGSPGAAAEIDEAKDTLLSAIASLEARCLAAEQRAARLAAALTEACDIIDGGSAHCSDCDRGSKAPEEWRALASDAPPVALTVGAALADPRVREGAGYVVEFFAVRWAQVYVRGDDIIERIWWADDEPPLWTGWLDEAVDLPVLLAPCRLVPLSEADADPAQRGPHGAM